MVKKITGLINIGRLDPFIFSCSSLPLGGTAFPAFETRATGGPTQGAHEILGFQTAKGWDREFGGRKVCLLVLFYSLVAFPPKRLAAWGQGQKREVNMRNDANVRVFRLAAIVKTSAPASWERGQELSVSVAVAENK